MLEHSNQAEQYVLFHVGVETYALEIRSTQEVLRFREPKRIPHAPDHVLGVINLRGQIIPIVGLRERFSQLKQEPTEETRIIVAEHNGQLTGLVADSVERVVYIPAKNIESNPEVSGNSTTTAIRGVARLDDEDSVIFLIELSHVTTEQLRDVTNS
jgi:purine-binding chemotaxis protein CheW